MFALNRTRVNRLRLVNILKDTGIYLVRDERAMFREHVDSAVRYNPANFVVRTDRQKGVHQWGFVTRIEGTHAYVSQGISSVPVSEGSFEDSDVIRLIGSHERLDTIRAAVEKSELTWGGTIGRTDDNTAVRIDFDVDRVMAVVPLPLALHEIGAHALKLFEEDEWYRIGGYCGLIAVRIEALLSLEFGAVRRGKACMDHVETDFFQIQDLGTVRVVCVVKRDPISRICYAHIPTGSPSERVCDRVRELKQLLETVGVKPIARSTPS